MQAARIYLLFIPLGRSGSGPLSQRAHPRFALYLALSNISGRAASPYAVCICIERRSLAFFSGRHCGFHLPFFSLCNLILHDRNLDSQRAQLARPRNI
jgi:hypothetical protein